MTFKGKIALVTGSTRGIGWATAQLLAERGATVLVNGHSDAVQCERRATELRDRYGGEHLSLPYDVASGAAVAEAFKTIFKRFKRLDVLVNNAGILEDALLGMIREEAVGRILAVNVQGAILNLQAAARLMMRKKQGAIVNVSSIFGTHGNEGLAVYSASKAALLGLTKSAAKELAPHGIRVNAVTPGFIDTDMTRHLPPEKQLERLAGVKMERRGTPEEVGNVIAFLASDLASYVTGTIVGVDGGMIA